MGRLHGHNGRSDGRLHVLVRKRVLHPGRPKFVHGGVADARWDLQVAWLPVKPRTLLPAPHNRSGKTFGIVHSGRSQVFLDLVFSVPVRCSPVSSAFATGT